MPALAAFRNGRRGRRLYRYGEEFAKPFNIFAPRLRQWPVRVDRLRDRFPMLQEIQEHVVSAPLEVIGWPCPEAKPEAAREAPDSGTSRRPGYLFMPVYAFARERSKAS